MRGIFVGSEQEVSFQKEVFSASAANRRPPTRVEVSIFNS